MDLKAEASNNNGGGGEMTENSVMANDEVLLYRGLKKAKRERGCTAKERISKMPPCAAGKRSSIYRGVTRHRWTGRYEAHLWDKTTWNTNQNKKGKQVYLGAYDDEEAAARAYDLAALKYWGPVTLINFPVTDYTRDLEEMQNVSREDYLASLRRKSSGFSRGMSKCRGISSRWEPSFGRMAGSEYCNSIHYAGTGDDSATDSEYVSNYCIERKIDLANYIKWWGSNKTRQSDCVSKSSDETKHGSAEDIGSELKTIESASEPYQMPRLGLRHDGKKPKGPSAMSILSRSAAFKNMEEKSSKMKEPILENEEDENKNNINKMEYGKSASPGGDGLGMSGNLDIEGNVGYTLAPFLTAPLITNYSSVDPLADPVLWPSMDPGLSHTREVTKTEASTTYTYFQQNE